MEEPEAPDGKLGSAATLSLVSLLHIAQLLTLLSGLIYWFASSNGRYANTEQRLADLQTSLTGQMSDLRQQLAGGNTDLRSQIANLPDLRAQIALYDRRFADHEKIMVSLDARLATLERNTLQLQVDYNSLLRSSQVPLKDGRR